MPNKKFKYIILMVLLSSLVQNYAQKLIPFKLSDASQTASFTAVFGEDSDFLINPPSFTNNGNGTVSDNNTGLMWQRVDGGEMTIESATAYCTALSLGGYNDWRLPTSLELFNLNHYDYNNPAIDTATFTKTLAEYWWTSERRVDDTTKVWAVNAGGGVGAHPKTETISAGGTRRFHIRAVRNPYTTSFSVTHFTDNGDGTIKDNYTGLTWQKVQSSTTMTWLEALAYANSSTLTGKSDWRIPNVKELQSLNDVKLKQPSFNKIYFPNILSGNYWSSTTLQSGSTKAWDINVDYGIVSYNEKTLKENVLLVRGGLDNKYLNIDEAQLPGGEYQMGDHFGFVDPGHPSDEIPVHLVKVDPFYMAKTETTNSQFLTFLNSYLLKGLIEVRSNTVYKTGTNDIFAYTYQYASYYSIGYDGKMFKIYDFRDNHPVVGVMWYGAVAFCNWLSSQNSLEQCYSLATYECDFTKNGYRLPTEAEWEFAGRGGNLNPYLNYPSGNIIETNKVNLPASGDPYEVTAYPNTTPVAFYDGVLKKKTEYWWPGSASTYQTGDGANGYGLYDMQGNVWEFLNDWYGQQYYSVSPYDNPKGPDSTFRMPDGKPYRGMRGGNWYNGLTVNGVNDGHSRVSNRNPSYYRGPQDPNHPYYHLGFRFVRKNSVSAIGNETIGSLPNKFQLNQNYPNPFNPSTVISYILPCESIVKLVIYDILGQVVKELVNGVQQPGNQQVYFKAEGLSAGIYLYRIEVKSLDGNHSFQDIKKLLLLK